MPSLSLVAATGTSAADGAVPHTPVSSPGRSETAKGKRKADDVDTTPPDPKKATFAVPGVPHVFFYAIVLLRHANAPRVLLVSFPARTHVLAHVLPCALIVPQQTRASLRSNAYAHTLKRTQYRHILLPHLHPPRTRTFFNAFGAPRQQRHRRRSRTTRIGVRARAAALSLSTLNTDQRPRHATCAFHRPRILRIPHV